MRKHPVDAGHLLWRLPPHATTRLSVCALDALLAGQGGVNPLPARGIDIGTGSGVLAIVAARLGVKQVVALDIDPCARKEAADNIALNDLSHSVVVFDGHLEAVTGPVSLVIANLRLPTLKRYAPRIEALVEPGGAMVFSGIRENEAPGLAQVYGAMGDCVWEKVEGGWCAMVFIRKPA